MRPFRCVLFKIDSKWSIALSVFLITTALPHKPPPLSSSAASDVYRGQTYTTRTATGVANDATHLALGVVHALSKGTALYATWARIDNEGTGVRFGVGLAPKTAGGASSGFDLGIRHSF